MLNAFLKPAILLFLCTLPVWVLFRLLLYKTRFSAGDLRRETAYFIFYSYLVLLAAVTVLPVEFSRYNNLHTRGVNLVPVKNSWIEIKAVLHTIDGTGLTAYCRCHLLFRSHPAASVYCAHSLA
jgi:hypothetical protein